MFDHASLFIPDGAPVGTGLSRCTHLGIAAHQDDLEFMAYHGIQECYQSETKWFGGVICTDGAGSSRNGPYANYTDQQMREVRREEQKKAAVLGNYGAILQLDHPSSLARQPGWTPLVEDLKQILSATRPEVLYTHNPADKHQTHVSVFAATLLAVRSLPVTDRPLKMLGCEVWRDLDWMSDDEKTALDVSRHEDLSTALNGIFHSQIAGGKRYDLAVPGRRLANATFFNSHSKDQAKMLSFAMDLTPLMQDTTLDVSEFVTGFIDRFRNDVKTGLDFHFPR